MLYQSRYVLGGKKCRQTHDREMREKERRNTGEKKINSRKLFELIFFLLPPLLATFSPMIIENVSLFAFPSRVLRVRNMLYFSNDTHDIRTYVVETSHKLRKNSFRLHCRNTFGEKLFRMLDFVIRVLRKSFACSVKSHPKKVKL